MKKLVIKSILNEVQNVAHTLKGEYFKDFLRNVTHLYHSN